MLPQYERLVDGAASDTGPGGYAGSGTGGGVGSLRRSKFRVRFGRLAVATVMLPVAGFLFCVIWSLLYNFEQANATHCLVYNFLPSLSAAIGNYQPQRFVWQFSVLFHAPFRYAIAFLYKNHHLTLLSRKHRKEWAYLACILNIVELSSLVGLSLWTSSNNYGKPQPDPSQLTPINRSNVVCWCDPRVTQPFLPRSQKFTKFVSVPL